MPKNKNAFARVLEMDKLFSSGDYFSKDKLRKHFRNVISREDDFSDRIIEYDISDMKSGVYGVPAPIKYSRSAGGYYYAVPGFSIFFRMLDERQKSSIRKAIDFLNGIERKDIAGELSAILNREAQNLEDDAPIRVSYENHPTVAGYEHFDDLYRHISHKDVLQLSYQSYDSDEPSTKTVHPYLLKEYRNRWYLIAFDESREAISNFGLDRIHNIEKYRYISHKPCSIDLNHYFRDIIGISVTDTPVVPIRYEVYGLTARHIEDRPLHHSQKIMDKAEGKTIFEIRVRVNQELKAELMRYGSNLKVISPAYLAKVIGRELALALAKYNL